MAAELGQRLAAEARSAGAEKHDVARALSEPGCGRGDAGQIPALLRQKQQRQAAVGVPGAQPGERFFGAGHSVGERAGADAVRADALGPCKLNRPVQGHSGCYSVEVTPCGLPTTVTSRPALSRRLATRLVSSRVTASI